MHRLVEVLQRLVEVGNTVLIIEHNLDVIKTADYLIDLGPEGGERRRRDRLLPARRRKSPGCEASYTGHYLRKMLSCTHRTVPGHRMPRRRVMLVWEILLAVLLR